ncbi:MAG: YeeE/YedE thiosulfate transporter family protein [Kiloniellaceae bacterium]
MILPWRLGGLALGLVFLAAVVLVKPIGVSTQFVIFDGILWDAVSPTVVVESLDAKSGYASPNAYLNKSGGAYAKEVANPLNYSFVFVVAMIVGAAVSALLRGGVVRSERAMPPVWRANFGDSPGKRYLAAFVAGFVVLYGARLAGGCTSGHMMSGMMQTAASGYIFAAGVFLAGIPLALLMFRREG